MPSKLRLGNKATEPVTTGKNVLEAFVAQGVRSDRSVAFRITNARDNRIVVDVEMSRKGSLPAII